MFPARSSQPDPADYAKTGLGKCQRGQNFLNSQIQSGSCRHGPYAIKEIKKQSSGEIQQSLTLKSYTSTTGAARKLITIVFKFYDSPTMS